MRKTVRAISHIIVAATLLSGAAQAQVPTLTESGCPVAAWMAVRLSLIVNSYKSHLLTRDGTVLRSASVKIASGFLKACQDQALEMTASTLGPMQRAKATGGSAAETSAMCIHVDEVNGYAAGRNQPQLAVRR